MRYSFLIDQSRCIGCHACSLACKAEHNVPLGSYRTWVKYVEKGGFPDVRRTFTVLRCNHCELAPCIDICPVTALYRRDDGIVDFDRDICIGCKGCMQACPYDALYIHPEHGTAEKCNFCSHRLEVDLEPPCATVCPTEAILVGDLDNPQSRVAQVIATQKVSVRKPEKGTLPKVFYIEGEPRSLIPSASSPKGGFLWADQPQAGNAAATPSSALRVLQTEEQQETANNLPPLSWTEPQASANSEQSDAAFFTGAWAGMGGARTVYDVSHDRPWGWKVSGYLWTKSISAGAFLLAALEPWLGFHGGDTVNLGLPFLGLAFLALTTLLLVADLKRPERFWTILTRPNWNSWLARGAFILLGFGSVGLPWAIAELVLLLSPNEVGAWATNLIEMLRWPTIVLATATAGYSGFLFAQAKGRDFWQSSALPAHLVVQAAVAGVGLLAVLTAVSGADARPLVLPLTLTVVVHLALVFFGEIGLEHATQDAQLAARELSHGSLRGWFHTAIGLAAGAVIIALATSMTGPGEAAVAGSLALAAIGIYEHAWLLAGQKVPLS